MGRRMHCLDCHFCAIGPGADGGPCFQCEHTGRVLPTPKVWANVCAEFEPQPVPAPPAAQPSVRR